MGILWYFSNAACDNLNIPISTLNLRSAFLKLAFFRSAKYFLNIKKDLKTLKNNDMQLLEFYLESDIFKF